jgi:CSLREA domain-containing protein
MPATAATLTVNTTRDELVGGDGRCSLREAIAAVNAPPQPSDCGRASRGSNLIVLAHGRYTLSIPPIGPDDNASGDLNLASPAPLTITGAGPDTAVIDARSLGDRVLSVTGGARVSLVRLTITGGDLPGVTQALGGSCPAGAGVSDSGAAPSSADGGGIFNSGTLALNQVAVVGNTAAAGAAGGGADCGDGSGGPGGSGGGVYNAGSLILTDSTVQGNAAGAGGAGQASPPASSGPGASGGPGGTGGGIYSSGRLQVTSSTLWQNFSGAGGPGAGLTGRGGAGGSGGAIAVTGGPSTVRFATLAGNGVGTGGAPGSAGGSSGTPGGGGGLFVVSSGAAGALSLASTIVASNTGSNCAASPRSAITGSGHDLSYGDGTCPGQHANPELGPLRDNGGPTQTLAIRPGSPAIDRIPRRSGNCPATDQRGVHRPQGRACDIGAYEFAIPEIIVTAPPGNGSYERGSRVIARFRCQEGGVTSTIASCRGSVRPGHPIPTRRLGSLRFVVTAIDRSGQRVKRVLRYVVWEYVNPLREVSGLTPRRIDLGVDYAGSGPLLALGRGQVTTASNTDDGPQGCWAISCWPGGGIVVYRLLDGPFAGKYVYVAEHITVNVRVGQTVSAGQQIATLYAGYPWSEWGWAAGPGPEALAMADGHRCSCSDPGGWSTIEGRDMNHLLVRLGAPSGWLQATPSQSLPPGWPSWPG